MDESIEETTPTVRRIHFLFFFWKIMPFPSLNQFKVIRIVYCPNDTPQLAYYKDVEPYVIQNFLFYLFLVSHPICQRGKMLIKYYILQAPSTSGNQGTSARSTTTPADALPLSNIGAGTANITHFKGADMEYFVSKS